MTMLFLLINDTFFILFSFYFCLCRVFYLASANIRQHLGQNNQKLNYKLPLTILKEPYIQEYHWSHTLQF